MSIIRDVKELSATISPSTLKEYNLKELLKELLLRFYTKYNIESSLLYEGKEEFDQEITLAVYRIVEERLISVQDTEASKVMVNINAVQKVHISIEDNGFDFNKTKLEKAERAFQRIKSRVEAYGGNLCFGKSVRGYGLTVTI